MPNEQAKLLVVDDDPVLRTVIGCTFTEAGYLVRTAADGVSALAEMRRDTPDVLLSDLNMPGMSGFELLSEVRRCFPDIRTIAMSSAFSDEMVPSGVTADRFYPKASGMGVLLRLIGDASAERSQLIV
jgi:CheY-like chemotaxis protein